MRKNGVLRWLDLRMFGFTVFPLMLYGFQLMEFLRSAELIHYNMQRFLQQRLLSVFSLLLAGCG